ncbi:hypothetical protein [Marinitoga sp. 38H-ov]|uniref:hypothetical protein n=1 Tax=Marinitoga sp. 38H-ov TaxID=1755814 RepID=UPI0013EC5FFC|nr:hypothetical protein [Marinitoga sp. 38H-ov]KAF2955656.1 hypothetical protein AS160_00655 [Marinitoga sp. 38H-ov]
MFKKKIFLLLSIISLFFGFASLFLFLFNNYSLSFIFLLLYFIFIYIILFSESRLVTSTLFKSIVSLVLFPFYPIIHYYSYRGFDPIYNEIDFEEGKLLETKKIAYYAFDLAPFNIILKYGDASQRKFVVRLIYNSIKEEKIDLVDGIELIKNAINIDMHPDVVLYATDALNSLEKFLINKIAHLSKELNSLENYLYYAKYSIYYLKSGFIMPGFENEFIEEVISNLKKGIEIFQNSSKLYLYYLEILEYIGNNIELEEILNDIINKYQYPEIYEFAILYYIKKKNMKKAQQLISKFLDNNFTPSHESIKFILGG